MRTLAKVARALNFSARAGRGLPPVLLLTDVERLPDPRPAALRLAPGSGIVLRHYGASGRAALARDLAAIAAERGLTLLVAEDAALARAVGADGLHLPERASSAIAPAITRRPDWLVTAAAHSLAALSAAARRGAHAALLSPVFATRSHPAVPPLGPARFAAMVRQAAIPVYALGGIDDRTAPRLKATGAVGIAAIGGLAG